jgi:hypothetical protein
VTSGYLLALIASGSPYVIASLLAAWVFVSGYSRSSKVWGGLGLIVTISVRACGRGCFLLLVVRFSSDSLTLKRDRHR